MKIFRPILAAIALCAAVSAGAQDKPSKYEMRAGWMASVANINWPAKKGLTQEELKKGFITYLDSLAAVNANAVIMQVRPTGDSFYPSSIEPWSIYLTGVQGQAPEPLWDPIAFMIEEAHKRGMEFHAWMNPYRIAQSADTSLFAATHAIRQHPEWFVTYGGQMYFDPGHPGSAKYTNEVVREFVSRYDVDGIHFDDYFYPYKVTAKDENGKTYVVDFPDTLTWEQFGKPFFKDKDAWRRNNVNQLIRMLSQTIRETKPWVKFGISPFGVWRNKSTDPVRGSNTQAGVQNYDDLYADILLWSEKGWIDYVTPQLYWKIGKKIVDYPILLDWWIKYSNGRHLYIGHSMGNGADEIERQIEMLRAKGYDQVQGSFYWNAASVLRNAKDRESNREMNPMLRSLNTAVALVPPMPWLDMTAPKAATDLKVSGSAPIVEVSWKPTYSDNLMYFLVYKFEKGQPVDVSDPSAIVAKLHYKNDETMSYYDKQGRKGDFTYAVTAVSRNNIESPAVSQAVKVTKTAVKTK